MQKETKKKRESKTARLEEELKAAKAEAEDYRERYLRALADLDNFRKRMIRDKQEYVEYANANLIRALLGVLDNFERALGSAETVSEIGPFHEGVKMIYDELKKILEKEGLQSVSALGEEFDPQKHEAVVALDSDEHPPNTVVDELEKGYVFKDRIMRPTKVAVSKDKKKEVD